MGQTIEELERDIRRNRAELGTNLQELEVKAKDLGDWRYHFKNHPFALLGLAFGGGILAAAMTTSSPRERSAPSRTSASPQSDTWQHIKDALVGVAATKVSDLVSGLVPGFDQEYKSRSNRVPTAPGSSSIS